MDFREGATALEFLEKWGEAGARSVGLATFFGFISSPCSFAALATTKSLFKKGAGLIPSLAFLLASTKLVIELGIGIIFGLYPAARAAALDPIVAPPDPL